MEGGWVYEIVPADSVVLFFRAGTELHQCVSQSLRSYPRNDGGCFLLSLPVSVWYVIHTTMGFDLQMNVVVTSSRSLAHDNMTLVPRTCLMCWMQTFLFFALRLMNGQARQPSKFAIHGRRFMRCVLLCQHGPLFHLLTRAQKKKKITC